MEVAENGNGTYKILGGAVIDCNDSSGKSFLDFFENNTPDLFSYVQNAKNGEKYDFKDLGKAACRYRSMRMQMLMYHW